MSGNLPPPPRGRGTGANPPGRFERLKVEADPDADAGVEADAPEVPTEFYRDSTRSLITGNDSPDVPYSYTVNPYRGCEHGCIYCYARPYHEYLGLSAGLDFETKIFVKTEAPEILRDEIGRPSWKGDVIALCGVTDPYQPAERRLRLVRRCLELCAELRQPVSVITKSGLVSRDADVLAELARFGAVAVDLTVTTLAEELRRALEPRTSTAAVRLEAISTLASRGIPVGVMVAPVIPGLTDHEIPAILARAAAAGARYAGYTMLRLPHGLAPLFDGWLAANRPDARAKVMRRMSEVHRGSLCGSSFASRMRGEGPLADITEKVFETASERLGLAPGPPPPSSEAFRRPDRLF